MPEAYLQPNRTSTIDFFVHRIWQEILLFKNHAENEAEKLVSYLFLILRMLYMW